MSIGDKVRYRGGRQLWTVIKIIESMGHVFYRLENYQKSRHMHGYLEDLKLEIGRAHV